MCVLFFARFRFFVRHLDFREKGASDKVGTNTVEILDPENIVVDTRIMFVSRRVPKLEATLRLGLSCKKLGRQSEGGLINLTTDTVGSALVVQQLSEHETTITKLLSTY